MVAYCNWLSKCSLLCIALKHWREHNSVRLCDWHREDMSLGRGLPEFCRLLLNTLGTDCSKKSVIHTNRDKNIRGGEVSCVSMDTEQCPPFWIHFQPTVERWLSFVCLFRLKRKKNSIWKAKVALALMITSPSHNMKGTNQSLGTDRHTHTYTHVPFYTHTHKTPSLDWLHFARRFN